ncbi:MAG TPA: hypothetical protein VFS77_16220, partial [Pyrinomonadaceae bacterium]|nr:hypothetical protein [Pyrinomonadaceae bacterium]
MQINEYRRLTRRLSFNLITALFVLFCGSQATRANEIAVWNFNDSNLNVDRGAGTVTTTINAANILFAAGT